MIIPLAEAAVSAGVGAGKAIAGLLSSGGSGKKGGKGAKDQPANASDVPVSASDYPAKDGETLDGEDAAAVAAETDGETTPAAVPAKDPNQFKSVKAGDSLWDTVMKWMDSNDYKAKYGPGSGAEAQFADAAWVYKKVAELNAINVPDEDDLAKARIKKYELRVEGDVKAAERNDAELDPNFKADKTLSLTAKSLSGCGTEIGKQLQAEMAGQGDAAGALNVAFSKHKMELSASDAHPVHVLLTGQATATREQAGGPVNYMLVFEAKLDGKTEAVAKVKDGLSRNPLTEKYAGQPGSAAKASEELLGSFRSGVKEGSAMAKALFDGEKIPASAFK